VADGEALDFELDLADWDAVDAIRVVSIWSKRKHGLALVSVRPNGAHGHDEEAVSAFLIEPGGDSLAEVPVAEPRLSTTYDGEGRQRRASLELWQAEDDDYPRRATGEAIRTGSRDLGELRLESALFSWRLDGEPAVGSYDILRRAR
jgi:hypothetical protein